MKIENEWLDTEINQLNLEVNKKKRRKNTDNWTAFKLFLMVTAVFFYAPVIEARCSKVLVFKAMSNANKKQMGEGRNFICPKCRTCQWQDDKNADWAGNFHCRSCGANLGK